MFCIKMDNEERKEHYYYLYWPICFITGARNKKKLKRWHTVFFSIYFTDLYHSWKLIARFRKLIVSRIVQTSAKKGGSKILQRFCTVRGFFFIRSVDRWRMDVIFRFPPTPTPPGPSSIIVPYSKCSAYMNCVDIGESAGRGGLGGGEPQQVILRNLIILHCCPTCGYNDEHSSRADILANNCQWMCTGNCFIVGWLPVVVSRCKETTWIGESLIIHVNNRKC